MTDIAPAAQIYRQPLPARNYTIDRLNTIKPGERIRYYRGHYAGAEIEAERGNAIVAEVFRCASRLAFEGRVELHTQPHAIAQLNGAPLVVTDYFAVGR